jgi:hypothetical protein
MKLLPLSLPLVLLLATFSVAAAAAPNGQAGYTMGMREYESSTVLQFIVPRMGEDVPLQERVEAGRKFMEKQRKEIGSNENLRIAIQELVPGAADEQADFFDQVKKGLKVEYIRGTDLMELVVTSGDKRFSCDLANRLAENYLKNHMPKEGEQGPIIHQKAVIGVPVEKKKQEIEQGGNGHPVPDPESKPVPR